MSKSTSQLPEKAKRRQLGHLSSHHPKIEHYRYDGKDVQSQELRKEAENELGSFMDMMNLPPKEALRVFEILTTYPFAISRVLQITYEGTSESVQDTDRRSIFTNKRPEEC